MLMIFNRRGYIDLNENVTSELEELSKMIMAFKKSLKA